MKLKIRDSEKVFEMNDVHDAIKHRERIKLIKLFRSVTDFGLKDSKDAMDLHTIQYEANYGNGWDRPGIIKEFEKYLVTNPDPYTKEEFMNLIEKCVDNMEVLAFVDMLEATLTLLTNVKKNGGLEKLAKERDEFLDSI